MTTTINVDNWDIAILVVYFITLFGTGLFALFTSNRSTVSGYFLAGRFMTFVPIGASLFASNIGSEHFIGLAGSGAAAGIAVGAFELNASLILQLLGWIFLPVYIASGVCTLPEYMMRRYGGKRIHIYLAVLSLMLYVFTKISVNLYSGSLFLTEALHWNTWLSITMLLVLTAVITITGGLTAVLYTDTLQFFIMIIGALILSIISYVHVGGFPGLIASYGQAIARVNISTDEGSKLITSLASVVNKTNITSLTELANFPKVPKTFKCSLPSPKAFTLLRSINDPDMPWLGFLIGQTPASIWYWCADQMMVQRVLAAKSLSHAQGATLMAGVIKQLPLFIMVIPGMISRVLFPDEIGCLPGPECEKVCGQKNGCSNLAYPKLVISLMPSGLRGLMLAVMLAALISDLTSIFNSASTLFTVDIYKHIRKHAKNMELMIVGRVFVVFLVLLSIAWVPVIHELQGSQLFIYIQAICACLSPPVAAVFLCAVLIKRTTEKGAFTGLMLGLILGLIRMILTIIYHEPICGETDTRPWIVSKIHYMYFAVLSFASTVVIVCLVSLCEEAPASEKIIRLTYWTAWDSSEPIQQISLSTVSEKKLGAEEFITSSCTNNHNMSELSPATTVITHSLKPYLVPKTEEEPELLLPHGDVPIDTHKLELSDKEKHSNCYLMMKSICLWICGCSEKPCIEIPNNQLLSCSHCYCCNQSIEKERNLKNENIQKFELSEEQQRHVNKLVSLKQSSTARWILRVGLICIFILSVFCFIFFSVYFGSIQIGPIPLIGSQYLFNDTKIKSYHHLKASLDLLEQFGLVYLV